MATGKVGLGAIVAAMLLGFVGGGAAAQNGPGLATVMRATGTGFTTTLTGGGPGYFYPNGQWLTGDFNGDGRGDLLHAVQGTDYVHPWLSNGDGTFAIGQFRPWAGYGIPNGVWLTGDINADGRTDIVHAVANTNYVHTWISTGNGNFNVGTFRAWNGYGIPNGQWFTGDFNGDRRADLLHAVNGTDYVHLWMSNGNGTFNILTFRPWAGYGIPNGVWRLGDFNGDGRTDIFHGVANTDYAHVWTSNGNGTFAVGTVRPWAGYPMGALPDAARPWMVADINADRRADLINVYALAPVRSLRVARHNTAALTDAQADAALNGMTITAFRNDNGTDVSCPIRYTRNGAVAVFNNGTGNLNTQAQFNDVINNVGAEVKVVSQINWCATVGAGIIGCAPTPGGSLTVVRIGANQEGILWLHERSHNNGNGHRNDTSAVMNPFIANTALGFNQAECNAVRN